MTDNWMDKPSQSGPRIRRNAWVEGLVWKNIDAILFQVTPVIF